jgi:hypothetical protein
VRGGVPFDVAFSVDDITRAAWCITMSEFEGNTFDWSTMSFKDQK